MLFTIYHNPQWGKSRKSLELLRNNGVELEIIEYLKTPLTIEELKSISYKLELSPRNFVRENDSRYKELNINQATTDDEKIFELIIENPRILERPIIVSRDNAVIGRPPENILSLL